MSACNHGWKFAAAIAALWLLAGTGRGFAAEATNVWNHTGAGNWSDTAKWKLSHVPAATEDVYIGKDGDNGSLTDIVTLQAADPAGVASNLYVGWRTGWAAALGAQGALVVNAAAPSDTRLTVGGTLCVGGVPGQSRFYGQVTQSNGVVNVAGALNLGPISDDIALQAKYTLVGGTLNAGSVVLGSTNQADATATGMLITQATGTTFNVTGNYTEDRGNGKGRNHVLESGALLQIGGDLLAAGLFNLTNNSGNIAVATNATIAGSRACSWSMSGGTFNVGETFTFGSAGLAMTLSGGTMKLGNLVSSSPSVLTLSGSGVLLVKNANYSTNQANTHLAAGRIVKMSGMTVSVVDVGGTDYTRIGLPEGVNVAPEVSAGADQTVYVESLPTGDVALNGSATDDGLPSPPGAMTFQWSKQSGLGTVNFTGGTTVTNTTATFDAVGVYVLRLVASDSELSGTGTVSVTISTNTPPSPPGTNVWNDNGAGDWSEAAKWSLTHVPTYAEDVYIGKEGNYVSLTNIVTLQAADPAGTASNLYVGWRYGAGANGAQGGLVVNATGASDARLTVGGTLRIGQARYGEVTQSNGVVSVAGPLTLGPVGVDGLAARYTLAGGTLNAGAVVLGDVNQGSATASGMLIEQAAGTAFNVAGNYTEDRGNGYARNHVLETGASLQIGGSLLAAGLFNLTNNSGAIAVATNVTVADQRACSWAMSGGTVNVGGTFTFGGAGLAMTVSGGTMKLGNLVSSSPSVLTLASNGVLLVKNANYSTNQANTHLAAGRIVKSPEMVVGTATVGDTLYTRIGLPPPPDGTLVVVQ